MARNLNPRAKRNRRLGEKLTTHGEKAFSRRPYPPGQHGPKGAGRSSEYGIRLREKQKAQLVYGILERQFRKYVESARHKVGDTGQVLLHLLEFRLDNIVFRSGFAPSREAARQLVRHGHVTVNGRRVTIPSYTVRGNDLVGIHPTTKNRTIYGQLTKTLESYQAPTWIDLNKSQVTAKILGVPTIEEISSNINPQLIVEFYSR